MRTLILCIALLLLTGCTTPTLHRHEFHRVCMGVHARIVVYAPDQDTAFFGAASAFDRIADLEQVASDYRPSSELSRLCQRAGQGPVRVSDDLFRLLSTSQRVAEATEGAFDPTIGPLTRLWRNVRDTEQPPSDETLAHARSRIGYRLMKLDAREGTAELLMPGMLLDLGGIAKGDAAHQALLHLRATGLSRALVALAGDIALGDAPPGKRGWEVRVEHRGVNTASRSLLLSNTCVSTSGQTEQSVIVDGARIGHVIDARSGTFTSGPRWSVTVITQQGAEADALATALCVMGAEGVSCVTSNLPHARLLITHCSDQSRSSIPAPVLLQP